MITFTYVIPFVLLDCKLLIVDFGGFLSCLPRWNDRTCRPELQIKPSIHQPVGMIVDETNGQFQLDLGASTIASLFSTFGMMMGCLTA